MAIPLGPVPAEHKCDFKEYGQEVYQLGETGALRVTKVMCKVCPEKEVLVCIGHFGAKK